MTALSQILAGGRLTASALQGIAPLASVKAVDEPVTSSTTVQNDDALWLSLPANTQWYFELLLACTGAAITTGDIKLTLTWPVSGASALWAAEGFGGTSTTTSLTHAENSSGGTHVFGVDGANLSPVIIRGSITTGVAGTLQLKWAQSTSSATATVVKAGSQIAAWQVG